MSGPIPGADRGQPANLLHDGERAILVDCGDGATDQLGRAGISLRDVGTVVISHLHADHTAGLYGLLARRRQVSAAGGLVVYGPTGTRAAVEAIRSAVGHLTALMPGAAPAPSAAVEVVEVGDGSTFDVGPVTVTAATNSHYGLPDGSPEAARFQSLSYRFATAERTVVYTGDTGPSANVERLARGADLLVSEITEAEFVLARLVGTGHLPAAAEPFVRRHFEREHLSADEVGLLASRSDVGAVVVTHNPLPDDRIDGARERLGAHFTGEVAFAADLDTY